jgi:hypothetical protein
MIREVASKLIHPDRILSADEVLGFHCPIPRVRGVYSWYFRTLPPLIQPGECVRYQDGYYLLYVGISPRKPSKATGKGSGQTIRDRIRNHYKGNVDASTLRYTLASLLRGDLNLVFGQYNGQARYTIGPGEKVLSLWMAKNAFVTWMQHDQPWEVEDILIRDLDLPLNIQGNSHNPNHEIVRKARDDFRKAHI